MKSNKTKILFIGSVPPPYHGVTVQNQRLLNSTLNDEFYLIHLDTTDRRDLNNLGKFDFENIYLALKHLFKLIFLLVIRRPEIVYLTVAQNALAFFRDGLFIIISRLLIKAKVVVHFRGANYLKFYKASSLIFKKFIDLTYHYTNYGIVLGQSLKPMISKWFGDEQIFVVPNGTDFLPNLNKKKNGEFSELNLGYIGFLGTEKGTYELLNAFNIVQKKYKILKLYLAGEFAYDDGNFKNYFFHFIKENDLEDKVKLLGKVQNKEKEDFFLNTDIFIFPSWHEGHPNAILEAMASKCPVIATNVGAISESIIDGYNGYLIEKKSVDALVQRINQFVNNKEIISEMSKNSRHLFEKKFTSGININQMKSIFAKIGSH